MRSGAALLLTLVACGKQDDSPPRAEQPVKRADALKPKPKLEHWQMTLPEGWTAKYDAGGDKWLFTTPPLPDGRTSNARFERAPRQAVASPDAYLHHKLNHYWDKGTTAEFEKREAIRDGFAMTVTVRPAADPATAKRETFVVREIGNDWFQCLSEWVVDDAMRDQVVELCKSIKP